MRSFPIQKLIEKKINDTQAKNFMVSFYKKWLKNQKQPIADALRATKLEYIHHKKPELRNPEVWSPYVLVE